MRIERDSAVATRDGTPIAVDVFRPDGDEPVPVIAGISPYGTDLHWPERFPLYELVEQGGHMVWETPNGPQGGPMPMALGWLRASHRELEPERSLPYRPVHAHRRLVPLVPGEPTPLEVEIWPTSITLAPGDRLRLELADADDDLAPLTHDHHPPVEATIHVGGERASHLLVPVISSPEEHA